MARSIETVKQKRKPGRPATGRDPIVGVRMPPETRKAVEAWAAHQDGKLSLSEALRRLVERGLAAEANAAPKRTKGK